MQLTNQLCFIKLSEEKYTATIPQTQHRFLSKELQTAQTRQTKLKPNRKPKKSAVEKAPFCLNLKVTLKNTLFVDGAKTLRFKP